MTHVLQSAGSRSLTAEQWLAVQHSFYGGFAVVGGIAEVLGLACSVALILAPCTHRVVRAAAAVAALAYAVMLTTYLIGNAPVNAAVATWTLQTLPFDWRTSQHLWENAHAIAAGAAALAFTALIVASEPKPGPAQQPRPPVNP